MGGISNILNKHFSKDTIRIFAIEGKQNDIVYQISNGFQREIKNGQKVVGYELTEKGKIQIQEDNKEIETLSVVEKDYITGIPNFYEEEKEYWKKHPKYTKEKEYRKMNEDEKYAYKHLQQVADTSFLKK